MQEPKSVFKYMFSIGYKILMVNWSTPTLYTDVKVLCVDFFLCFCGFFWMYHKLDSHITASQIYIDWSEGGSWLGVGIGLMGIKPLSVSVRILVE